MQIYQSCKTFDWFLYMESYLTLYVYLRLSALLTLSTEQAKCMTSDSCIILVLLLNNLQAKKKDMI